MNKNDNVGPKRQTGLWLSLGHKPVGLVVLQGTMAAKGEGKVQLRPVASAKTFVQTHNFNSNSNSKLQLQLQTERNRAAMRGSI